MQVLVGGQVACVHVFLLLQWLCLKLLGFFFILRLTYILWQCAYIWHRPLGFTMTRDFGFLCIKIGFFVWNPLFTQVVTILSHACDEIHKRPWYVCAFSAELVHISVEKISEYHTLTDKPNLTSLYNGSCVPSVTFLKHILYILSQFSISSTFKCLNGVLLFFFLASLWLKKFIQICHVLLFSFVIEFAMAFQRLDSKIHLISLIQL